MKRITFFAILICCCKLLHPQETAMVITNSAHVYNQPDINSTAIIDLPIWQCVKLHQDQNNEYQIDYESLNWVLIDNPINGWVKVSDIAIFPISYYNKTSKGGFETIDYYSILNDIDSNNDNIQLTRKWQLINNQYKEDGYKELNFIENKEDLVNNRYVRISNLLNILFSRSFTSPIINKGEVIQIDKKTNEYKANGISVITSSWMRTKPEVTDVVIENSNILLPYNLQVGLTNSRIIELFGMPEEMSRDSYVYRIYIAQNVDYKVEFFFTDYSLSTIKCILEI